MLYSEKCDHKVCDNMEYKITHKLRKLSEDGSVYELSSSDMHTIQYMCLQAVNMYLSGITNTNINVMLLNKLPSLISSKARCLELLKNHRKILQRKDPEIILLPKRIFLGLSTIDEFFLRSIK